MKWICQNPGIPVMYYVNANTGDIEVAMIRNAESTKSMKVKDIGSMKEPVKKFVEKNYRNFTTKKMTLADSKIIDHGDAGKEFVFYWNKPPSFNYDNSIWVLLPHHFISFK